MIEIDPISVQSAIAKFKKEYEHISGDVLNKAISNALNRSATEMKTRINEQIRAVYNLSASKLNNELKVRYSNSKSLTSRVVASGAPISWNNFQAKQIGDKGTTSFDRKGRVSSRLNRKSRNNAAKGVSALIKRSEGEINLPTAFIQTANGGLTVFARGKAKGKGEGFEFGKKRMPIGKITSTSVPLMFANKDVIMPVEIKALDVFNKRMTHEIKWLLSK